MLTEERQAFILEKINRFNTVKLKDLIRELNTSESTVRRDLDDLESRGLLKRVRGGAIGIGSSFTFDYSIKDRSEKYLDEKKSIGRYCSDLVKNGDFVYLDSGTTTYEIIPFLKGKDIVVVTNGIYNVERLIENKIKTFILGGSIKPVTKSIIGEDAIININKYRFNLAFIGANGITLNSAVTTPDISEAVVKSEAIRLSKNSFVVADSSKFGQVSFAKICELDQVRIVTDSKNKNIDKKIFEVAEVEMV